MKRLKIEGLEELSKEQMKEIEGGCFVSCGAGFYACCNPDSCKCLGGQQLPPPGGCVSGGVGSISCGS